MKKLKTAFSVFLCLMLLLGNIPFQKADAANSPSAYVALGDSITAGYGLASFDRGDAGNKTSEKNFVTRLGKKLGMKTTNFGVEGQDTSMLLKSISKPSTADEKSAVAQIKKAGILTISIGGNNVLWPVLDTLNERIGGGKTIYNAEKAEIQSAALGLLLNQEAMKALQKKVEEGVTRFTGNAQLKKSGEFSSIISTLKKLNPKAKIIVQTVYNPYKSIMPQEFDNAIKAINSEIMKGSLNGENYLVADVYAAFSQAAPGTQLVNADMVTSFDPHPTAKGHEVIYTLAAYAANNTLPYKVNAIITKGRLKTGIEDGQLVLTVLPAAGYKAAASIWLTIGKGQRRLLTLKDASVTVPIAAVDADIYVSGICKK